MDRRHLTPAGITAHPIRPGRKIVYLLHFDQPYQGKPTRPDAKRVAARHYIGLTVDLGARLARHAEGGGAKLLRAVKAAGIGWRVVAWYKTDDAGRLERQLKDRKNAAQLCPVCNPRLLAQTARTGKGKVELTLDNP